MQDRQGQIIELYGPVQFYGQTIPESPRPIQGPYDTACWWATFYSRSWLRMWNRH